VIREQDIPTAEELMTRSRLTLRPEMDILAAIDELVDRQVAAAPVVDENEKLLGVLTEKDCLRVLSTSAYDAVYKEGTVGDYMSTVKVVVEAHMDLFQTVKQFLSCNFPTLPVVQDGRLLGRLSRKELLRATQRFIAQAERERKRHMKEAAKAGERPRSIEEMQQSAASHSRQGLAGLFSRNR
jgi:CBS domain-containing protein